LNVRGRLFTAATRHKQHCCDIKIDKKGTLKATEHEKYETISGLIEPVHGCNEMHITAHAV
jgi:hypothetical protein